jgi:hypothetical protein
MAGCEGANCLRSHVDLTESYNALSMITKAGVPADKVIVGISSYGRQFRMTNSGCTHANCTFVGPQSKATPGRCTDVPDYISNAEIKEIVQKNPSAKVFDTGGGSKYMTYDGNWVSYMDDMDKISRTNLWKGMNFGGAVEWAIDLNSFDHDGLIQPQAPLDGLEDKFSVSKGHGYGMRRGGRNNGERKGIDEIVCPQDDSWRKVNCTTRGIVDKALMTDSEIWADVKAAAAWCAAISHWTAKKTEGAIFPSIFSDFLHGPDGFRCDKLETNNGCSGSPSVWVRKRQRAQRCSPSHVRS